MRNARRSLLSLLGLAFVGLWLPAAAAGAQAAPPPPAAELTVETDLVSEARTVAPGSTFWVGLRQRIPSGWHTYWINPGDSGEPATIEWKLPPGVEAGAIAWPHPRRIPVGSLMGYGYEDEVVLPIPVTVPASAAAGTRLVLDGQARWLVCEKICIPEETPVTLAVSVGPAASDPAGAAIVARARRAVPGPSPWPASYQSAGDAVTLTVAAPGLSADRITDVWFYPLRWGAIEHAGAQKADVTPRGITIRAPRGELREAVEAPIDGVLVITERLDRETATQAFTLTAVRGGGAGAAGGPLDLARAVGLALLGGLVLNLMPCVLPVLSIKALALVQHAGAGRAALATQGAVFTAGVLVSFAALAGALLALRAGGEQVGWGFQLQSPWFVAILAYVLFTMALVLSGVVRLGGRLAGLGHGLATRGGLAGAFFSGALATVAATPCTAPFMGVAVGYAVTRPWGEALLVFEALGLGLALPYLLLSLAPAWRRFVPKPGAWMGRLAEVLAFPLYASVAWLVWVLSQQAGPPGVAATLSGLLLIAFAAWLWAAARDARPRWRRMAAAGAVVSVGLALAPLPLLGGSAGLAPAERGPASSEAA